MIVVFDQERTPSWTGMASKSYLFTYIECQRRFAAKENRFQSDYLAAGPPRGHTSFQSVKQKPFSALVSRRPGHSKANPDGRRAFKKRKMERARCFRRKFCQVD
jgi:hypothetical protein